MLITALLHVILHFAVQLQVLVSQQFANLPSAWQLATALGVDRALYDLDTRMHSALDNIWLRPTRTIAYLDDFEWQVLDDVARIIAPDSSVASANVAFTDNYGYFFDTYDAAKPRSGPPARGGRPRKSDVRAVLLLYVLGMATGIALSGTHRVNKIPNDTGDDFEPRALRPSASMPVASSPAAAVSDCEDGIVPEAVPVPDIVDDSQHTERASSPVLGVDIPLPTSPSPSTIGLYEEEEDAQPISDPLPAASLPELEDDEAHDEDDEPARTSQDGAHVQSSLVIARTVEQQPVVLESLAARLIADLSSADRATVQPFLTLLDDAPLSNFWVPEPPASVGPSQSVGDYNWDEISSAPMESLKNEVRQRVLRFRSESLPVERPDTDLDLDLQDPIGPGAGPVDCVLDTAVDKEDPDSPTVSLPPLVDDLLHPTDSHAHHDCEVEQPSSSDQVPPTIPSVPLPSAVDEVPRSVLTPADPQSQDDCEVEQPSSSDQGPPPIPSVPLPSEVDELPRSALSTTDPHVHHDREVEQPSNSDDDPTVQANDFSLNFIPPPPPPPLDFSFTQWILHDGTSRKDAYVHLRKVEGEEEPNVRRGCRMRTGHRPGVKVVLTPLAPNLAPLAAPKQPDIHSVVVVRPPIRDLEALGWERRALSEVDGRYDLDFERDADSGLFPYAQSGEEPPSRSSTSEADGSHLVDTATASRSPTPEDEGSGDLIGIPVSQIGCVSVLPESAATQEEDDMIPQAVHVRGTTSTVSAVVSVALASALPVTVDSESLVTTPASGTQLQVLPTVEPSNGMATVPGAVDGVSISLPRPTVTTGRTLLPVVGSSDSPQVSSRSPTPILTPEEDSSGHAQSEGGRARRTTLLPVAGSSTGHRDSPRLEVPSRSPTPILTPEDEVRDDSSPGRARGTTLRATVSESNVEVEIKALETLINLGELRVATNLCATESE